MKKLILTSAAAASLAMLSSGAYAQCMIYSQPNYQGAAGIIQPNDAVLFDKKLQSKEPAEGTREFFDPSWLNNLESSKTTNSCKLVLMIGDEQIVTGYHVTGDTPKHEHSNSRGAYCKC
jgi:hypothetical protein